ncbi:MAG TPA: type II secretion system protein [Aquabacterium sp.]|nr:type II secretion system protein [Aquabacterium sp.]
MPSGRRQLPPRRSQRGFVLVAWLIVVALFAATASMAAVRWSDELRREREQELLRLGDEIAGAIASYRAASAGSARKYPPQLEDLLEDRRAFGTLRHLRRLSGDPVMRGAAWGVVRAPDGGVMGVYSTSTDTPMRRIAIRLQHADLPAVGRYAEWHFVPRETQR